MSDDGNKVLDFSAGRKKRIDKKRRQFERLVLSNFLGAQQEISKDGITHSVSLVDISRSGCRFQIYWNSDRQSVLAAGSEVTLRMYFAQDSYIPVVMQVKYGREYTSPEGTTYMQYGCEFDTSTSSFEAMSAFIDFLDKYAEHSIQDQGSRKVWYL